jgi:hypothetical protein
VTGRTRDSNSLGILEECRDRCDFYVALLLVDSDRIAWMRPTTGIAFRRELLRKEVIQPQVPLRLPCYDFTPITSHTLGDSLLAVGSSTSGSTSFRGVTGGVYKARERIHRGMLIRDY